MAGDAHHMVGVLIPAYGKMTALYSRASLFRRLGPQLRLPKDCGPRNRLTLVGENGWPLTDLNAFASDLR
jgi:hypothetical protein